MSDQRLTLTDFRQHFPLLEQRVYLNSCSQGALSIEVDEALRAFLDSWRRYGSPWDTWVGEVEALREAFARQIGAEPGEVAVLPSASVAIDVVASALSWETPRADVVMGDFEFPTMGHVWLAQQRRGARIRWIRAGDGETLPLSAYEAAIDRHTRIVPVAHVCFRNGFRVDLEGISRLCRERGAWLMVDDYQRTGTAPIDVRASGIDMLVTGALKYLLGPPGIAYLYVRRDLIAELEPAVTGWFGRANPFAFQHDVLDWSADAHRFENGTPPIPNVYAALAGLRLLARVGDGLVDDQVTQLTQQFLDGATEQGWHVITPTHPDRRGPLCVLASTDAQELTRRLARHGIICSARGRGLRVSFHGYNDLGDVDAVLTALRTESGLIERAAFG